MDLPGRGHDDRPRGRGLTRTTLFDQSGEVGTATQTLFVEPRTA